MLPTFMPTVLRSLVVRGCSTSDLVKGRGTMSGGYEVNYPNTLDDCTDGNSGKYLQYESLERIKIESLSGDYMSEGSLVKIKATAFVYNANDNHGEIYYKYRQRR
jgi:hypothetical protein